MTGTSGEYCHSATREYVVKSTSSYAVPIEYANHPRDVIAGLLTTVVGEGCAVASQTGGAFIRVLWYASANGCRVQDVK